MNKLKKKYQYITLAVITIIYISILVFFKIQPSWYISIIVYISSWLIGSLIFQLFIGMSINKFQFVDSENDQIFYFQMQLGFGKVIQVKGTFRNTLDLTESEIFQILRFNTPRKEIFPLYKNHEEVNISYSLKNSVVKINFNYIKTIM